MGEFFLGFISGFAALAAGIICALAMVLTVRSNEGDNE